MVRNPETKITHSTRPNTELVVSTSISWRRKWQRIQRQRNPIPEADKKKVQSLHFYQLFSFTGKYDWVLMISGSLGAIVHDSSMPIFFLLFNEMVNGFGKNQLDLKTMTHEVSKGQSQPSSAIGNHSIQGVTVYTPQGQSQPPFIMGSNYVEGHGHGIYSSQSRPVSQSQPPFAMGRTSVHHIMYPTYHGSNTPQSMRLVYPI
ncbi:hypothetical protein ACSBR1_007260 [Camellia fascicularis]